MSIYDDPELKTGGFVSWKDVGDTIAGDVIDVRKGTDFNNKPCPELVIRTDDGEDHTLTCGQAQLRVKVLDERPEIGDRIRVVFTGEEKADRGMKKTFTMDVVRGGAKGTAASDGEGSGSMEPF